MKEYKKRERLRSLLALCFSTTYETYHHWKIFADGIGGVRIEFDFDWLVDDLSKYRTVDFKKVDYLQIKELRQLPPDTAELPFLKRYPYSDEKEFRIIYRSRVKDVSFKHINISRKSIKAVTLSPWCPEEVFKSVRAIIRCVPGCKSLKVTKSTLIDNAIWKRAADSDEE
ncbi:DUF2971 domain-containing protein [Vibrio coralliilyticus]|uniref:DUF2971 domain-containing protein n=1 Tax=Vibrio coralliilyticus TaxID=190893 RepID=UPI00148C8AA0|nr:DUF2971 domain-containing protein [Vibrio coralliilyticus]NOI32210.1 DUF2971 domain-containing protein [Vibrio coralliilyticus]NOI51385.1 DUF2971 domain-containing protein [Vibrio coralliilyticus]